MDVDSDDDVCADNADARVGNNARKRVGSELLTERCCNLQWGR